MLHNMIMRQPTTHHLNEHACFRLESFRYSGSCRSVQILAGRNSYFHANAALVNLKIVPGATAKGIELNLFQGVAKTQTTQPITQKMYFHHLPTIVLCRFVVLFHENAKLRFCSKVEKIQGMRKPSGLRQTSVLSEEPLNYRSLPLECSRRFSLAQFGTASIRQSGRGNWLRDFTSTFECWGSKLSKSIKAVFKRLQMQATFI